MLIFCGELCIYIHQEYWLIVFFYYNVISSVLGPVRALSWVVQKPVPWEAFKKLENWSHAPLFSFSTEREAAELY